MNVIDLFCGCGGLSLGFKNAGYNILAAIDNWKAATDCYRENFKHPVYNLDLSNAHIAAEEIRKLTTQDIDMIIGGPPCQDFSHAGARTEGERASLTTAFASIIATILPRWFVMENVDRAIKSLAYIEAKSIFQKSGYGLTEIVLDASKCNVPQKRKRLFVIGLLNAPNDFLLDTLTTRQSKKSMTIRDYLGEQLGIDYYYRHPRNYNRRGVFSIDEPSPTIRGVNRPIPSGYSGHPKDPVLINSKIRPLSTKERTLIQTFPNEFKLLGSKTVVEQLIGNAVPVNLANFVAKTIKDHAKIYDELYGKNPNKTRVVEDNVY